MGTICCHPGDKAASDTDISAGDTVEQPQNAALFLHFQAARKLFSNTKGGRGSATMVAVRVSPWEAPILGDTQVEKTLGDGLPSILELQISGQWLFLHTS